MSSQEARKISPPAIRFSRAAPEKHWFTEILTVSQITEIADEIAKVNDVLAKLFLSIWRDYNVTGR